MKKLLKRLSEKFLDKFYYSYIVQVLNDEFEILIFLNQGELRVAELYLKYLPPVGIIIKINEKHNNEKKYLVEKIEITQSGSVAYIEVKSI